MTTQEKAVQLAGEALAKLKGVNGYGQADIFLLIEETGLVELLDIQRASLDSDSEKQKFSPGIVIENKFTVADAVAEVRRYEDNIKACLELRYACLALHAELMANAIENAIGMIDFTDTQVLKLNEVLKSYRESAVSNKF